MRLAKVRESFNFSKLSSKFETVVLDSSVWVSALLINNRNHLQATKIVQKYSNSKYTILIPEIVFFEVITVFARNSRFDLAEYFMSLGSDSVSLTKEEFLNFTFKYKNYLRTKTQDSLIIMHCLKYNATYFETFDAKQKAIYNLIKSLWI